MKFSIIFVAVFAVGLVNANPLVERLTDVLKIVETIFSSITNLFVTSTDEVLPLDQFLKPLTDFNNNAFSIIRKNVEDISEDLGPLPLTLTGVLTDVEQVVNGLLRNFNNNREDLCRSVDEQVHSLAKTVQCVLNIVLRIVMAAIVRDTLCILAQALQSAIQMVDGVFNLVKKLLSIAGCATSNVVQTLSDAVHSVLSNVNGFAENTRNYDAAQLARLFIRILQNITNDFQCTLDKVDIMINFTLK